MRKEEISLRIEQVMKTDATFAREADFMLTHVPFKKLYDFIPESGQTNYDGGKAHYYINPEDYADKKSYSENELLERFLANPQSHRFLLVQGNSGTGKSNLIRWICYMYQKELEEAGNNKEQIIFIRRSYNSLKDAVKRILDYNILSADRTRHYLDKIGGGGQAASGAELAAMVYANLCIAVQYDQDYDLFLEEDEYKGVKILLDNNNIKKYVFMKANGPVDKLCVRISGNGSENDSQSVALNGEEIFSDGDLAIDKMALLKILMQDGHKANQEELTCVGMFAKPTVRRKIVIYLNSLVEKIVARSSTLDTTDLQGIFREIRKELKAENKNLTLFIEDINAYTGMDKALIEMLIDEKEDEDATREMCRLKSMVGSTDNFYDLLPSSVKERITESIVVLDGSVLSDESKLLEFAARYINAVNLTKEQVDTWYKNHGDMPIAEIRSKVTSIDIEGKTYSIFPFTKEAIINLFNCLELNYRTPRGLLKYVVKHNVSTWNTMGAKMFESTLSFINVGVRSYSNLVLPRSIQLSMADKTTREKLYIQVWGYDYKKNIIVNSSEEAKTLFEMSFGTVVGGGTDGGGKLEVPPPPPPQLPKTDKKDRALVHIDEWEKNINKDFVIQKDVRKWIGEYILGHINWQFEEIPYSRAAEVCKGLSFIGIEGHEGQGNAKLNFDRTIENADFFRALTYWNYDGERKSWDFPGGMEEQIIAKVWLENNKLSILEAIKDFGRVPQISPAYVVKAKFYSCLISGVVKSLDKSDVIEALTRGKKTLVNVAAKKNSKWTELANAVAKHEKAIENLFKEYFYRVVGSRDVVEATYTFVDITFLGYVIDEVLEEVKNGKDKGIACFGNKNLECPIEVINMYQQKREEVFAETDMAVCNALPILEDAFGKDVTKTIITSSVHKMQRYLEFIAKEVKHITPAGLIKVLEDADTPDQLLETIKQIREYKMEKNIGNKIILLSVINEVFAGKISREIINFKNFMQKMEDQYASNVNRNIDKEINRRKEDIQKLVDSCIKAGGE